MLVDCTPYSTICRIEWRLRDSVRIFRDPEPHALLIHKPVKVDSRRWHSNAA